MTSKGEAFQYRKNNKVANNKTCELQSPKQPVPAHIRAGRILYARCRGQPFHVSRILMVDTIRLRCYVRFEDGTTHWCLFGNIQNFDSNESTCCLCHGVSTSLPSSLLVKCDQCKLAFHPECHNPPIDFEQSSVSRKWSCRVCTFSTTSVIHGMSKRAESAPSSWARNASSNPTKHETLEWDVKHRTNKQNIYCYCRKPGCWSESMLQCLKCLQWFHYGCINSLRTKPLSGDAMFVFVCSLCMPSSHEYLRRIQMKWLHVVHLSLFCLGREMNAEKRKRETFKTTFFDVTRDILPWMQNNWKQLMPGMLKGYPKDRREARVTAVLNNHPKRFLKGSSSDQTKSQVLWRLKRDRPPGPPKIWLPDNGTPLSAKLLDQVLLEMSIKCSEQGRLCEKQTNKEASVNLGSEIGANVGTNCPRIVTESSASGFARNSRRPNHVAAKTHLGADSAAIPPSPGNRNDRLLTFRVAANGFPDSHETESSSQGARLQERESGRASASSAAMRRRRRLNVFRSNAKLRKNHLIVGESKFSSFGKSRLNLSKSSADLLLRDRIIKDPENFEILGHAAKANDIAKALKHPRNVVDKEAIDEISNREVSLSELKSSVSQYFGAASRVARGERCRILGRRTSSDGSLQYHVEWQGGGIG